MEHTFITDKYI